GLVGRLAAGEAILIPRVDIVAGNFLDGEARERARQRLGTFVKNEIERRLAPLLGLRDLPLAGVARGLVFELIDALGCVPAAQVASQLAGLDAATRRLLARGGVRFGVESVYVEPLLRGDTVRLRALLWAVRQGRTVPRLPGAKRQGQAIPLDPDLPPGFYAAIGRRVVDGMALRPDRLETFAAEARRRARRGGFAADAALAALAGISCDALPRVLAGLGYRTVAGEGGAILFVAPRRRRLERQPAR